MAEVRPQVNGIIQKRLFVEGSNVKAGQVLFQIDPALYKAALARAEANLQSLQIRVDRFKELLVEKAVSQQEFDDATAALKQTLADIETARINLQYTAITAPISGRIGRSSVTEGALVSAQQPVALATIQQIDPCMWTCLSRRPNYCSYSDGWQRGVWRKMEKIKKGFG